MELLNQPENTKPTATSKVYYRISKRWKQVRPDTQHKHLKDLNDTIAMQYHRILKTVKEKYLDPGTVYFQRDYKDDTTDPFRLHGFICNSFHFMLECDFTFVMQIEYDFHNCSFEAEILSLLKYATGISRAFHTPKQPILPEYLKAVTTYQDSQFIHTH